VNDESNHVRQSADPAVVAAVSEVLVRYATSIDSRDWKLFRTCFTDDCEVDYGQLANGEVARWDNVEAMATWMDAAHLDMGYTLHRITNQHVEGDERRVKARSYVDVLLMTPGGELIMHGAGFYDDELLQSRDGWKIATRRFTPVRMEPGQS
jgi:3-phenylpropionate/cinnamic acid dioxygenase small subunit